MTAEFWGAKIKDCLGKIKSLKRLALSGGMAESDIIKRGQSLERLADYAAEQLELLNNG